MASSSAAIVAAEESDKALAVATREMDKNSHLVGRLFPMFSKLFLRDSKSSFAFKDIFNAVVKCIDNREVALFAAIGWGLVPLTHAIYDFYENLTHSDTETDDYQKEESRKEKGKIKQKLEKLTPWDDDKLNEKVHEVEDKFMHREIRPFEDTFLFHLADHISQASKIGILVMSMDVSMYMLSLEWIYLCCTIYTSHPSYVQLFLFHSLSRLPPSLER